MAGDTAEARDIRTPRLVAATVGYKAAADVVSKAVTLGIVVASGRLLPGADFGVLALAMTTGWILGVASDAGLPLYLAKRVAEQAARGARPPMALLAHVMRMRAVTGGCAGGIGVLVAIATVPASAALAYSVIVVAQLLGAMLETLSHAYRGIGRSDIESGITLVQRLATGVAAAGVLALRPSLDLVAVTLAIPPGVALLASWRLAKRGDRPLFEPGQGDRSFFPGDRPLSAFLPKGLARDAAPVGLGILLSALYFRCDVYFVERWHGLDIVGVYNAAFRIVEALRLVPAAVLAVAFPVLCTARDFGPVRRIAALLAMVAIAATGALYLGAPRLLDVVYGARFVEATPALRILALALPLFFANYALTHQVIGWDGQRLYLGISAAALVTNLTANAWLIPRGGMEGAALATFLTEVVVMSGCLAALWRLGTRARPSTTPLVALASPIRPLADAVPGDRL